MLPSTVEESFQGFPSDGVFARHVVDETLSQNPASIGQHFLFNCIAMAEMYTIKHQDKMVNAIGQQLFFYKEEGLIRETETKYQRERVLNAKQYTEGFDLLKE